VIHIAYIDEAGQVVAGPEVLDLIRSRAQKMLMKCLICIIYAKKIKTALSDLL